jgi:hypothetical protein
LHSVVFRLSETDRRLNVESRLLAIVSSFGGERIIAGPRMEEMVGELADQTEQLAREGLLPAPTDDRAVMATTERPWCGAPHKLGGQQPCPLIDSCDARTCRLGSAVSNETYRPA